MLVGGNVTTSYFPYRVTPHDTTVEPWLKCDDVGTRRIIYIIRELYANMRVMLIFPTWDFSCAAYCLRPWVFGSQSFYIPNLDKLG